MNKEEINPTVKKLLGTMDAKIWAEEFVKIVKEHPTIPTDEGTMIGWFANAIMVGYDRGREMGHKESAEAFTKI